MHLATQPKEPAEVHDQRTPTHRIDMRPLPIVFEKPFIHVQLHDVHFEAIRTYVLAEWSHIVNYALHLHRAFVNPRRRDRDRWRRRESGGVELLGLITVSPRNFLFGHGILASCERQPVDMGNEIV
jgi:hypothetical protein